MSIPQKRRESLFFRALSEIISHQLTNSDLSPATVTGVELSKDSKHLKVYVVFDYNRDKSLAALERTKSFIRSQLAIHVNARIVPDLVFKYDDSFDRGKRVDKLLKEIKAKDPTS